MKQRPIGEMVSYSSAAPTTTIISIFTHLYCLAILTGDYVSRRRQEGLCFLPSLLSTTWFLHSFSYAFLYALCCLAVGYEKERRTEEKVMSNEEKGDSKSVVRLPKGNECYSLDEIAIKSGDPMNHCIR